MKNILIPVLIFAICYLLVAFIVADVNSANWEEVARLSVALIGIGVNVIYFTYPKN